MQFLPPGGVRPTCALNRVNNGYNFDDSVRQIKRLEGQSLLLLAKQKIPGQWSTDVAETIADSLGLEGLGSAPVQVIK